MLINSEDDAIGEGPRLYAVVVSGPKHQQPTLWKVRAWDAAAAEVIAVAEAGYEPEEMDYFADSVEIGTVFKILGHPDQLPPVKG